MVLKNAMISSSPLSVDGLVQPSQVAGNGLHDILELVSSAHRLQALLHDIDPVLVHSSGFLILGYGPVRILKNPPGMLCGTWPIRRAAQLISQPLLEGNSLDLVARRFGVGNIIQMSRLLSPEKVHRLFHHQQRIPRQRSHLESRLLLPAPTVRRKTKIPVNIFIQESKPLLGLFPSHMNLLASFTSLQNLITVRQKVQALPKRPSKEIFSKKARYFQLFVKKPAKYTIFFNKKRDFCQI